MISQALIRHPPAAETDQIFIEKVEREYPDPGVEPVRRRRIVPSIRYMTLLHWLDPMKNPHKI